MSLRARGTVGIGVTAPAFAARGLACNVAARSFAGSRWRARLLDSACAGGVGDMSAPAAATVGAFAPVRAETSVRDRSTPSAGGSHALPCLACLARALWEQCTERRRRIAETAGMVNRGGQRPAGMGATEEARHRRAGMRGRHAAGQVGGVARSRYIAIDAFGSCGEKAWTAFGTGGNNNQAAEWRIQRLNPANPKGIAGGHRRVACRDTGEPDASWHWFNPSRRRMPASWRSGYPATVRVAAGRLEGNVAQGLPADDRGLSQPIGDVNLRVEKGSSSGQGGASSGIMSLGIAATPRWIFATFFRKVSGLRHGFGVQPYRAWRAVDHRLPR